MATVTYLSHAGFEIRNGLVVLIDPYFVGNNLAPTYSGKPDLILVTHEHFDHYDRKFISKFTCPVVCPHEVRHKNGIFMKPGEKRSYDNLLIHMFGVSHHQSTCPNGYVLEYEGKRIAHLGDTYLDGVKELGAIDVLLVPIGGHYTMSINEATEALKILKPKLSIPMHFNTFPEIKADPTLFKKKAEKEGFKVEVLGIGDSIAL
jgi:L-ascorbate metabolism protein UlaG (beta-lactamase superfamily)